MKVYYLEVTRELICVIWNAARYTFSQHKQLKGIREGIAC